MRITQNTLFNQLRNHITRNTQSLLLAQETVATQKRFNRLSENPIDGGRVLDLNSAIARATQHIANIDRASGMTDIQDTTLEQVGELMARAKELLLGESNDSSSTAETREAARIEIAILTDQMLQAANTRFDGKYIFSGFQTDQPAFASASVAAASAAVTGGAGVAGQQVLDSTQLTFHDYEIRFTAADRFDIVDTTSGVTVSSAQDYVSGDAITFDGLQVRIEDQTGPPNPGDVFTVQTTPTGAYMGDGNVQEVEVEPGSRVAVNIPGDRAFKGAGLSDGVDVFDTMNRINQALADNDRAAMRDLIGTLDAARQQISNMRAGVGARTNLLEAVKQRQADVRTNMEILQSDLEDIDVAEAVTQLNRQQNLYEATLSAGAKIVQPSLLDFLR